MKSLKHLRAKIKEVLQRTTPASVMLTCIALYVAAVIGTVIVAHVALILHPDKADASLAARLIAPVRVGLEFLDIHWKGALLIVAPFLLPAVNRLIRRIRKVKRGDTEIELKDEGVHEIAPAFLQRKDEA